MAEYSSLKVPELKKLLAEKGLSQTGNKADLVARLAENDKQQAEEEVIEKPAETVDSKKGWSCFRETFFFLNLTNALFEIFR